MQDKIYEILEGIRPEFDFHSSNDFLEDGYLDSFDIVTIISEIESEFEVVIDGMDVLPENFANVDTIIELINKSKA